jgi:hypothetical protein
MIYKIAEADSTYDLEVLVNNMIAQGYEPIGSLICFASLGKMVFMQPMLKKR